MSTGVDQGTGEDLARVTVISPTRRIDLALPGGTPLVDLLPNIVRFAGYEGGSTNDAQQAWVLQRFGEDPLDVNQDVGELGLRDGETLHLRQRQAAMPDAAFDDVVDAVATATGTQPAWRPVDGQRYALALLAVVAIAIPGAAALAAPGWLVSAGVLLLSLACGFTAILLARAFGQRPVAGTLAWVSTALAGVGAFNLLVGTFVPETGDVPVQLLCTAAFVLVAAGAMALGTQVTAYHLLGVALSALVVVATAMAVVLMPGGGLHASAIALALVLAVTPLLPGIAFRMARVAMPNLPSTAEGLMADKTPVQSDIVERAISADRFLGGFLVATGLSAVLLSIPVFLGAYGWAPVALLAAVALALLLRARAFTGRMQRTWLLVGGTLVGLMAVAKWLSTIQTPIFQALAGLAVVVLAVWLLGQYATSQWNRVMSPVWGRWGDILEWLAIMAIVPLLLAVLDVYSWAYGLGG
ncbi:type VII secretion integral membrane protein EccD [Mariniluteicoccus flavus]